MLYIVARILVLAATSCTISAQAVAKTRVLVLHPYSETLPASLQAADALRDRLLREYGGDLEFYSEFLDLVRFPGEQYRGQLAKHLAAKYASKQLTLVAALGEHSLNFALDHRPAFGSETPLVYCCVKSSRAAELSTAPKVFGIPSDYEVEKTVKLALRLQPRSTKMLVISGASELDRFLQTYTQRLLEAYDARLEIQYLSAPPLEELLRVVAKVPRDTIVLFLAYLSDQAGRHFTSRDVGGAIAQAASAPTYAIFDTSMGTGIVGGHMGTFRDSGAATADLAIQVLAGTLPAGEEIRHRSSSSYFVDARQLARWDIPRSSLPPGTIVQFETQSIWATHRKEVITAIAAFTIVTMALAIALLQVRRRMSAETHLRQSEERLNVAAASGGIGLWQYDVRSGTLWSSEHCRTMFGLPPDCPLTVDAMLRRVHPQDRSLAAASIRAATNGSHAETLLDFRIVRPDGQIRSIRSTGHRTLDAEGEPLRVSGIFRDLTAYRSIQKEARELSRRILSIQDDERQRIAQELHDSTAQHLAAINLNLAALQATKHSLDQNAPVVADIQNSLVAAMNEMRTFTYLLYPQELSHDGLHETLIRYVNGYCQRTGLTVNLRLTNELNLLSHSLQHSLLRIMQESLANVHRHASASRVAIKVQRRGDRIHLLIADNGVGLQRSLVAVSDKSPALPLGVGIPGMTARARQLGGDLDVRSRASGTLVHATLPVEYEEQAPASDETSVEMNGAADTGDVAASPPAKQGIGSEAKRSLRSRHVLERHPSL